MSIARKPSIDLRDTLKEAAMQAAPAFPDFEAVYARAEARPRALRRVVFAASLGLAAAAASFWVGISWQTIFPSEKPLIDGWSMAGGSSAVQITLEGNGQQSVVLASSKGTAVSAFVQGLWESPTSDL
ncbi:MAG: hypothetical protein WHT81_00270 [Rectinemataceae bacterium]